MGLSITNLCHSIYKTNMELDVIYARLDELHELAEEKYPEAPDIIMIKSHSTGETRVAYMAELKNYYKNASKVMSLNPDWLVKRRAAHEAWRTECRNIDFEYGTDYVSAIVGHKHEMIDALLDELAQRTPATISELMVWSKTLHDLRREEYGDYLNALSERLEVRFDIAA